jgi:hypothetical protein
MVAVGIRRTKFKMKVFLLWHTHAFPNGEEDAKLIGVYSSSESAQAAQQRASSLPGFCDAPEGFSINPYEVDSRTIGGRAMLQR